jgi:hypothetical protein
MEVVSNPQALVFAFLKCFGGRERQKKKQQQKSISSQTGNLGFLEIPKSPAECHTRESFGDRTTC